MKKHNLIEGLLELKNKLHDEVGEMLESDDFDEVEYLALADYIKKINDVIEIATEKG